MITKHGHCSWLELFQKNSYLLPSYSEIFNVAASSYRLARVHTGVAIDLLVVV